MKYTINCTRVWPDGTTTIESKEATEFESATLEFSRASTEQRKESVEALATLSNAILYWEKRYQDTDRQLAVTRAALSELLEHFLGGACDACDWMPREEQAAAVEARHILTNGKTSGAV